MPPPTPLKTDSDAGSRSPSSSTRTEVKFATTLDPINARKFKRWCHHRETKPATRLRELIMADLAKFKEV